MSTNRISASSYAKVYATGVPLTIDLRTPIEHYTECLEGCIALPLSEVSPLRFRQTLERSGFKKGPVYLLCQSGKRAEVAADTLKDVFTGKDGIDLIIVEGGLNAVKTQGTKIKFTSHASLSIERQVRIASGSIMLLGIILGYAVHTTFLVIPVSVSVGLIIAGINDFCIISHIVAKMPWNG